MNEAPPRFNVLGVGVSALTLNAARDLVIAAARARSRGYVCLCDVNSISCARRDEAHRRVLNASLLTTPDGMPLVWLGRRAGHHAITRVYGPDLLETLCAATAGTELTHFFHGAGPGTADALAERVAALRPSFFWVGLSTPRQEAFMAAHAARLDAGVMLGVGAAFDFLSGRVPQAPRWMQRSGLEWLFRLVTEPRRLAPRYFKNNPLFVFRVLAQISGLKKYPLD